MTFTALLHLLAHSQAKCFDVSLRVNNLNLYVSHIYYTASVILEDRGKC